MLSTVMLVSRIFFSLLMLAFGIFLLVMGRLKIGDYKAGGIGVRIVGAMILLGSALFFQQKYGLPIQAILLLVALLSLWFLSEKPAPHQALPAAMHHYQSGPDEPAYRLFMGFYGLVFPAYVWLCMMPGPCEKPRRGDWRLFALAVAIAAPFYWLGFVEGRMFWLLPGLAVVLLSRVVNVPFRGRQPL